MSVDYEPATNLCSREKSVSPFEFACFGDAFIVCLQSGSPAILPRWFRLLRLSKHLPLHSSARRGETHRQEESTAWQRDSLRLEKKKKRKTRVCYTCSQAEEESRGQMHQGEEKRQGQKAQRSRKPPDTEHRERKLRRLNAGTVIGEEKQKKEMAHFFPQIIQHGGATCLWNAQPDEYL